eukprot:GHVN01065852.1.p1 GENE.GHVN01065852.1~~GHVN01065852.1.p1  ORF type:complete len:185 (+),score=19.71 GHVN01065852.1:69-557(+)
MAPELSKTGDSTNAMTSYGVAVDWWALGVLTYEMIFGEPPFGFSDYALDSERTLVQLALDSPRSIRFPPSPPETAATDEPEYMRALDFISKLLTVNEIQRLGCSGVSEVKQHTWFHGFDWDAIQDVGACGPAFAPGDETLGFSAGCGPREMCRSPSSSESED